MRAVLACLCLLLSAAAARAQTLEYYALDMGWLPGQCLVDPEIAACADLSLHDPRGRNLTLIGLKPEARPGTTRLRDCDPLARTFVAPVMGPDDVVTDCARPKLRLDDKLAAALAEIMPGVESCAERAYWSTYGSCSMLSQQRYFERAVDRARDMQRSLINLAIAGAVGQRVSRQALVDAFLQQFGADAEPSLQLVCARSKGENQWVLTGIRVTLHQLGSMRALGSSGLWRPAAPGNRFGHRCPERFLIAEPGVEEPPLPAPEPAPGEVVVPPVVIPEIAPPELFPHQP